MGVPKGETPPSSKVYAGFYDSAFDLLAERGGGKIQCTFPDGSTQTLERLPMNERSQDPNDKPAEPEFHEVKQNENARPITRAIALINESRSLLVTPTNSTIRSVESLLAEAEQILLAQDARTGKGEEAPPNT